MTSASPDERKSRGHKEDDARPARSPGPSADGLRKILQQYPSARYWIAYSGGLDSHVLLHLCSALQKCSGERLGFHAIHVHHGLHPNASDWSAHCERVCEELGIPFREIRVDARPAPGDSPEEAARRARYSAIRAQIGEGDIVLTAQHLDDQAETLLLQLMRGAGLPGLASMPEFAPLTPGHLLRPLLGHTRENLRQYALTHRLCWIEDPSNQDSAFDRNFLRREILPRLERRWPGVRKTLGRAAGLCAEAQMQLAELCEDLLKAALLEDGRALSVATLSGFKVADRRLVLREWIRRRGFRAPSRVVIERILTEVLPARQDKSPRVAWREGEVRRYRDGLFLFPPFPAFNADAVMEWNGGDPLILPGGGTLTAAVAQGPGLNLGAWEERAITVSYRQGGERCRLAGRSGTHELKKLFQEAGIEPWLRERAPLVFLDGELAAVAGWWVCEAFAAKMGEHALSLSWNFDPFSQSNP